MTSNTNYDWLLTRACLAVSPQDDAGKFPVMFKDCLHRHKATASILMK